jgi:hypothetical protein
LQCRDTYVSVLRRLYDVADRMPRKAIDFGAGR